MNLTLVIMAAGMGSRFGGLKQIEPVGPSGEIIADYSVYDAIRCGFKKVVFIIRREHLDYFKEHITKKFEKKIEVDFAFQELDMIPKDAKLPEGRVKMLGTGHAILCAKDRIDGDFAVINADDFYGYDAFKKASEFLKNENKNEFACISYPYNVTCSKNGKVKRGVIIEEKGSIKDILESEIGPENGKIIARTLTGGKEIEIPEDQLVSMNFLCFRKNLFPFLEREFDTFIHGDIGEKKECLIPEILKKGLEENAFKIKSIKTTAKWMGITYKEDLNEMKDSLDKLIKKGEYPNKLWD